MTCLPRPHSISSATYSIESVRLFKLATLKEVTGIAKELRRSRPGMMEEQAIDIIATATSMAGALWQMATPGPEVARLYRGAQPRRGRCRAPTHTDPDGADRRDPEPLRRLRQTLGRDSQNQSI